ncbi:MAG: adenylate/guanylate cyclase domain-containing protein [Gammaproteobacteria bacterium]|nr:adenylate/guanylate cyclase domain-containing protein [Gammaproteobacteria bacterium]
MKRLNRYSIPLAIRWSIAISALVTAAMGLLGWFLIGQQQSSYKLQSDLLGEVIIDQFTRAASEPLMADDLLSLQVLVSGQERNPLIKGMQVLNHRGEVVVSAGVQPLDGNARDEARQSRVTAGGIVAESWISADGGAISYRKPILFQDTRVGFAELVVDREPLERELARTFKALVFTTLGLILVGVMLAVPLAYRFSRPIRQLVAVGEAMDRGDSYQALPPGRGDEIGRIYNAFGRMADEIVVKQQLESTLSRYISPEYAAKVISGEVTPAFGGIRSEGSVLFCDIVGFTELSERLDPEAVALLLNDFFRYFAAAGHSCQGTVDKFIGDCIMIVFGVPQRDERHAFHALTCAVLIQLVAERINQQRVAQKVDPVLFRIGINSGAMLEGNLGSHERMQYTVVGDTVNVASRICGLAQPGAVLLTEESARQPGMREFVEPGRGGPLKVRGRSTPVQPYEVDIGLFRGDTQIQESLDAIFIKP